MHAAVSSSARRIVAGLSDGSLASRFHCTERSVAGAGTLVCGTGYTGEDGVELLLDPDDAPAVWDAVVDAGAVPAGLGARDTLRLEVCFHLYGNDLSEERGPIEAGLPMTWANQVETEVLWHQMGFGELVAKAYDKAGVRYVAPIFAGPYAISTKTPVNSLADLQKMKLRNTIFDI